MLTHTTNAPGNTHTAFAIAVALNGGLTILQVIYALIAHSNSLLADAGHNFGDVLGLLFSWLALYLSNKGSSSRYSYGYKKSTILASPLNAILLLIASMIIIFEAISHFKTEVPTSLLPVIVVAGIGMILNVGSALLFFKKSHDDLNIKSAFLHLMFDALTSLSVVIGGVLIYFTHINLIDPIIGLIITFFILKSSAKLFKHTLDLSLDGVPRNINYDEVKAYLASCPGVVKIHDLHIWAMSTTETASTAHIIRPTGNFNSLERRTISKTLRDKFKIAHTTLQIEENFDEECEHEQNC